MPRRPIPRHAAAIALVAVAALVGVSALLVGHLQSPSLHVETAADRAFQARLVGDGSFDVVSVDGPSFAKEAELSLRFAGRRAELSVGCNDMAGRLVVDGTTLTLVDLETTLKGCSKPQEQQVEWLAEVFRGGVTAELAGERLVLRAGDARILLTRRKPLAQSRPQPMRWLLLGTRRGGRDLVVRPYEDGGMCATEGYALQETPERVEITVRRVRELCGGDAEPAVVTVADDITVRLRAPLGGRLVTGPALSQATVINGQGWLAAPHFAIPDLTGLRVGQARTVAKNNNTTIEVEGSGATTGHVVSQQPRSGKEPKAGRTKDQVPPIRVTLAP